MSHRISVPLIAVFLLSACSSHPPEATGTAGPKSQRQAATPAPKAPSRPVEPVPLPAEVGIADWPEVRAFVREMSQKHRFDSDELRRSFEQVTIRTAILDAMAKPYEAKPWYAYRRLFLTEKRIQGGREFMTRNAPALAKAEARYGIPRNMVAAIIGIESGYGQTPGKYLVMDALSTLAFAYPKRAAFFRRELEQFLLLCREEGMDPLQPVGSYAGAMGMPQFMPSSYRKLAADGDGDGRRDIWNNPADAIASVARYFAASGWRSGEPVAVPANVRGSLPPGLAGKNPKPSRTLAQFVDLGVEPAEPAPDHLRAALLELEAEAGPEHWLVFHNFSVIMRYNHSPLYAMAAYELSRQ